VGGIPAGSIGNSNGLFHRRRAPTLSPTPRHWKPPPSRSQSARLTRPLGRPRSEDWCKRLRKGLHSILNTWLKLAERWLPKPEELKLSRSDWQTQIMKWQTARGLT
jgi:hypothetical protein